MALTPSQISDLCLTPLNSGGCSQIFAVISLSPANTAWETPLTVDSAGAFFAGNQMFRLGFQRDGEFNVGSRIIMKIVTPPLVIEGPDAFAEDLFNRKEYGQSLLNLVSQSSDELVISLDGKWGEGKSTFVKMWQCMVESRRSEHLYRRLQE